MITYERAPPEGVVWHPLANLFPWIEGEAMDRLREDIRENGVREPIVFVGPAIVDGRNRYMAARDLGIAYPRREFGSLPSDGTDLVAFVLSANLTRRHLTESQRAAVAAKLANMPRGNPNLNSANLRICDEPAPISTADAAQLLNVGKRSVEAARKVQAQGVPELAAAVEQGTVSVSAAAAVATLPEKEQAETVAAGPDAIRAKAREVRTAAEPVSPDEAKLRRDLAKLATAALIDDVVGLKRALAEERARREAAEREVLALKARLKEFETDDLGRALGNAQRRIATAEGQSAEYQNNAARLQRQVNAQKAEIDRLRAALEGQVIPL